MSKKIYTKELIIEKLKEIRDMGWIESGRHGNCGGIGNTLEDLLGIEENNLPIPNAAEWELKCQRLNTNSLVTLFHVEPSPTALKFVPCLFLPQYGWRHQQAGTKYPETEMSFRQTISSLGTSDRGFRVIVDRKEEKILISFNANLVAEKHEEWFKSVKKRVGLEELSPQPYWGFQDLFHKAGTKLHNCFFVGAEVKKIKGKEFFKYDKILKLSGFSLNKFIDKIEQGDILVDFDARTGHNHGTKFRFRNNKLSSLYDNVEEF
ncbi:MAG TPA: MvaI/BcnI family restriction endonuclease [Candidatus Gastranaerophilales bacterium]|nr:MvaI/BcnI family restriction endonuclease [Candidatus Gastranaerophilales bacterium]